MAKSFWEKFWEIIAEVAIIFASIQLATSLNLPIGSKGILIAIIMLFLALIYKYFFADK